MKPDAVREPDSVRLLAEKIVNLFTDEFPTPEYITAKIESLLREALAEAAHNSINMECLKCRRACAYYCRECYQGHVQSARSAAFKEAFLQAAEVADNVVCMNEECCGESITIADKLRRMAEGKIETEVK